MERKELERYRARTKANEKFSEAVFFRGLLSSLVFGWAIPYFTPNTIFWRVVRIVGSIVCMGLGILSSYYGPFKVIEE